MNTNTDIPLSRMNAVTDAPPADIVLKNATYVNVFTLECCRGDIAISGNNIIGIGRYKGSVEYDMTDKYVCPGFIDGYARPESGMVCPAEFARAVIPHGATTVIADPTEIVNVLGVQGLNYMLNASVGLPIDIYYLTPDHISNPVDDYKGAADIIDHEAIFHSQNLLSHSPNGIERTTRDCCDKTAALDKIRLGQYVVLKEGSTSGNLRSLTDLLTIRTFRRCLLGTVSRQPSELNDLGHIDHDLRKAVSLGVDPLTNVGAIAPGYQADIAVVDSLEEYNVKMVFKNGKIVYADGQIKPFSTPEIAPSIREYCTHSFKVKELRGNDFALSSHAPIITLLPNQTLTVYGGVADEVDTGADVVKLALIDRRNNTLKIGKCYLNGYGLKTGAIASSIAHDEHNLIVVGTNDKDMAVAANKVVKYNGGIVIAEHGKPIRELPLPIAGLMTDAPLSFVCEKLNKMKSVAHSMGVSEGLDPILTLSELALQSLPKLRLTTVGVLDVEKGKLISN